MTNPRIFLAKKEETEILEGRPYIFANEIAFAKTLRDGKIVSAPLAESHIKDGSLVEVYTKGGQILGAGIINTKSQITVRFLVRTAVPEGIAFFNQDFFVRRIQEAAELRALYFEKADSYRLIFSEADFIPGLVVERFVDIRRGVILVVQFSTLGAEVFRPLIIAALKKVCAPFAIYERSDVPSRLKEGLPLVKGWVNADGVTVNELREGNGTEGFCGENEPNDGILGGEQNSRGLSKGKSGALPDAAAHSEPEAHSESGALPKSTLYAEPAALSDSGAQADSEGLNGAGLSCGKTGALPDAAAHSESDAILTIRENGVLFNVDIQNGQKTGYFLDQKCNRAVVARLAKNRTVLDACTHTGSFALNAVKGGAKSVIAVDISSDAVAMVEKNIALNNAQNIMSARCCDIFDLLGEYEKSGETFDMIILDPPAFTKSAKNIEKAYGGYKEINRKALKILNKGGILVTCSCSHFFDTQTFYQMITHAAKDAKKSVQILQKRTASSDHPVLVGFANSEYLKCAVLRVL